MPKVVELKLPATTPWFRLPGETAESYSHFTKFLLAGNGRTLKGVFGQILPGNITRASAKWKWRDRVAAYDEDIVRKAQNEQVDHLIRQKSKTEELYAEIAEELLAAWKSNDTGKLSKLKSKAALMFGKEGAAKVLIQAHQIFHGQTHKVKDDSGVLERIPWKTS